MGNTFILVCSLPVNSDEDCVYEKERENERQGKGEKKENELTIYKSGEMFTH